MDRQLTILTLARAARKVASEAGRTPIEVLEDLLVEKFQNELSEGKALISTTEGGGTAGFAILSGMNAADIATLAHETISFLLSLPDAAHPTDAQLHPRRIKRLRVSLKNAITS